MARLVRLWGLPLPPFFMTAQSDVPRSLCLQQSSGESSFPRQEKQFSVSQWRPLPAVKILLTAPKLGVGELIHFWQLFPFSGNLLHLIWPECATTILSRCASLGKVAKVEPSEAPGCERHLCCHKMQFPQNIQKLNPEDRRDVPNISP